MKTIKDRIFQNSIPVPEAGCWIWSGASIPSGYGTMTVSAGVTGYAHRASWEANNGPIPDGLFVCHRCDTPSCVNPDHMFLGTHEDNMRDMRSKGRGVFGERHPSAILSESDVNEIRSSAEPYGVLANRYGVSKSAISSVRTGKNWSHIEGEPAASYARSKFVEVLRQGPMTTHQVAAALGISRRVAAGNLSKLFNRGKVSRTPYLVESERGERQSFIWEAA